jgi:hypothetical protein
MLKSVRISRSPSGRYFASILCEVELQDTPSRRTGQEIGVDLGLKSFLVTSKGEKIDPPQPLRRAEEKLCRLQRQLSRKQKGSRNREKARAKVARLHEKVADQRADFLHQQSRRLIDESLNVKGMLANHHLARPISDAGWGVFLRQLQYKAAWTACRLETIGLSSRPCRHVQSPNLIAPLIQTQTQGLQSVGSVFSFSTAILESVRPFRLRKAALPFQHKLAPGHS